MMRRVIMFVTCFQYMNKESYQALTFIVKKRALNKPKQLARQGRVEVGWHHLADFVNKQRFINILFQGGNYCHVVISGDGCTILVFHGRFSV